MAILPHMEVKPQWYPQYRTMAVGAAARRMAEGPVDHLVLPQQLALLVSADPSVVSQEPLFGPHVTRMSAGNERYVSYDPVIDDSVVEKWRDEGRLKAYPRSVIAVEGETGSRFVLHVDESRELLYVVPASLSPLEADDDR
jgi:hypothetical protein